MEERREAKELLQFERHEKAANRAAMTQMIASAVGGYLGSQEKDKKKGRRIRRKGAAGRNVLEWGQRGTVVTVVVIVIVNNE